MSTPEDEYGYEEDTLFSSTPAPTPVDESLQATTLPPELRPIDPKTMLSSRRGLGQWSATFESDDIRTGKSSAEVLAEQEDEARAKDLEFSDPNLQYDGPPLTGKGVSDLVESLGMPSSIGQLFSEMQEAVLGITSDLMGNSSERESLADILTHNNRMRGIGAMLVSIAVIGLLLDAFAESEKTSTMVERLLQGG